LRFLFANHVLDTDKRELRSGARLIDTEPQVFDVLVYLLKNHERVVSKDDLIDTVWNGRVVSDSTLTSRINAARTAIGDSGSSQALIRTVPRKGIRFIGEVRAEVGSSDPAPADGQPAATPPSDRRAIVVLPFVNIGGDAEQQYFADGITGNLTTDLSRIPDMLVISRNTAFTYQHRPIDTKQIGRELGVRYVLEGEVQRTGDQVRVTAQLIEAETDVHLWAERFSGTADDLFTLQDEITSRIAVALDVELVEAEASRPMDRSDTRDFIFRGRAVRLRPPSRESRTEAIALFEQALALDPSSATAQGWIAIALTARALDFMAESAAVDIARAEQLADCALAALPRSAIAHFAKAQVLRAQHRFSEAISEYESVVGLNRNWAHAYSHLGWCKFMTGSIEELIPSQQKAIRLSPRDPQSGLFYSRIGSAHLLRSRTDEAIVWYERARNAAPAHPEFRTFLASAYALKGDMESAAFELAIAGRLVGDGRYASIARFRAVSSWGTPEVSALAEETYFSGLSKAGVPDDFAA
jgi:TolB-like protein/Flp pilus assembly protein TadD